MELGWSIPLSITANSQNGIQNVKVYPNLSQSNAMTNYTPCKNSLSVGSVSHSTAHWLPHGTAGIECTLMFDESHPWLNCSPGMLHTTTRTMFWAAFDMQITWWNSHFASSSQFSCLSPCHCWDWSFGFCVCHSGLVWAAMWPRISPFQCSLQGSNWHGNSGTLWC